MPFENNGEGDSEGIGVRTIYIFNRGSRGGSNKSTRLGGHWAGGPSFGLVVPSTVLSYSAQWGVPKPNWIVLSNIYNAAAEPVLFLEWNGVQYRLERCRGSLTHFKPAKQGHD